MKAKTEHWYTLNRDKQKRIIGGVGEPCNIEISCPSVCGGGTLKCTSNAGKCESNYESLAIRCDNDPWLYCCPA